MTDLQTQVRTPEGLMVIEKFTASHDMQGFTMWYGQFARTALDSSVVCYVAVKDSRVIGFIIGENTKLCDNIMLAAEVLPEYRRKGVFSKIFDEYKKYAKGNITVYHSKDLTEFWRRMGFTHGENVGVSMRINRLKEKHI